MPAMRQVGVWWASGRCGVVQERITTETVRAWLDRLTTLAEVEHHTPPVLLACGPLDQHTLGLEALGALLAEQGLGSRRMGARVSAGTYLGESLSAAATVLREHRTGAHGPRRPGRAA